MNAVTSSNDEAMPSIAYLLIIAHPDDESMFFLPTIRTILQNHYTKSLAKPKEIREKAEVHILCLSNGNFEGLGNERIRELHRAADIFSQNSDSTRQNKDSTSSMTVKVTVIEHNSLQDGPNEVWSKYDIVHVVSRFLFRQHGEWNQLKGQKECRTKTKVVMITFDEGGVSGHPNHLDTYKGVSYFMRKWKEIQGKQRPQHCNYSPDTNHQQQQLEGKMIQLQSIYLQQQQQQEEMIKLQNMIEIKGLIVLDTISNPFVKYLCFVDLVIISHLFLWRVVLGLWRQFCRAFRFSCQSSDFSAAEEWTSDRNQLMELLDDGIISKTESATAESFTCRIFEPKLVWNAMAAHATQFVWYRRLSVLFSRYTYTNTLRLIDSSGSCTKDPADCNGSQDDVNDAKKSQ